AHAAATAGAGRLGKGGCLRGKGSTLVGGPGNPDLPLAFAGQVAQSACVPGDVDIAVAVGRHGATAVQGVGELHQVPLWLERSSRVVQTAVKHGLRVFALSLGQRLAGAIPGNVDPVAFAQGQLSAADCSGGNRAAGLAVHTQRVGEGRLARLTTDVIQVTRARIALEV